MSSQLSRVLRHLVTHVVGVPVAIALVLSTTGCSILGPDALRTIGSRILMGGSGELVRTTLCLLSDDDTEDAFINDNIAVKGVFGTDGSLYHVIRVITDVAKGCAKDTELILVQPNVVPLTNNGVPKWLVLDEIALTVARPDIANSVMSRDDRRMESLVKAGRGLSDFSDLRIAVRANR